MTVKKSFITLGSGGAEGGRHCLRHGEV
jgi:hypothetical protein